MYTPRHFEETQIPVLHGFIRSNPLGALVTLGASELLVDHIPFSLDTEPAPLGTLRGHVARANPVWREISDRVEPLVVFGGPQAYVSPNWYPSKHEHGKAVPTWNYVVVHAYGRLTAVEDPAWLRDHLTRLVERHEASRAVPWKVTDAPREFIDEMLQSIVGLEMTITRISGKWKMSQNRPAADRRGVVAGLDAQGSEEASAVAALVSATLE